MGSFDPTATRIWMLLGAAAFFVAGLMLLSVSADAQTERLPPVTDSTLDDVERYLETELSKAGRPGLATAIVHDGEIVLSVGLGEASPGVAMTADTPSFIASVSKSITAFALMQQVEAGRVDLDDPVSVYLPELEPKGGELTVRDLLHHRSGLSRFVGNEVWSGKSGSSLEFNVERLGPHLQAGSGYNYSNANYDALALIVQRVSGTPFADYVADRVFSPLGMGNSFVGPDVGRQDVAEGHYHWLFLGYRPFDQPSPRGAVGSATMHSTAKDLANFLIAHLQDGTYEGVRVLTEESVDELHTPRSFGIDLPEDFPVDVGYAGGLVVDASFPPEVDERLASLVTLVHGGSALGYRAIIWMIPEVDLGFVALTNGNNLADESWLPQVAQGAKHILFGVAPPEIEVRSPFLLRYGKQLLLALVAVQVTLAALAIQAFRGFGRRRFKYAIVIAGSIIDLTALILIFWVIPKTGDAPLAVALQAPDYQILIAAMSAGVIWGIYRTYRFVKEKSATQPSTA